MRKRIIDKSIKEKIKYIKNSPKRVVENAVIAETKVNIEETNRLLTELGENFSTTNLYQNIANSSVPVIIEEGLIKSYPTEKVISIIAKCFHLDDKKERITLRSIKGKEENYNGLIYKEEDTANDRDRIIIKLYKEDIKEKIDYYMERCGWFNSLKDGNKCYYEKRFDEYFFTFQLLKAISTLYHVAEKKVWEESIQFKGLKPKAMTGDGGYKHDERIYFFINDPEETKECFALNPVIIKIDLRKVNKKTMFHYDPRLEDAIYTYEPISPDALSLKEESYNN